MTKERERCEWIRGPKSLKTAFILFLCGECKQSVVVFDPFRHLGLKGSVATNSIWPFRPRHSADLAHVSTVLAWVSLSLFFGSSFSNFTSWIHSQHGAAAVGPFGLLGFHIAGQESLFSAEDGFFIPSGVFYFWKQIGIPAAVNQKKGATAFLLTAFIPLLDRPNISRPNQLGFLSILWAGHSQPRPPNSLPRHSLRFLSVENLSIEPFLHVLHHASVGTFFTFGSISIFPPSSLQRSSLAVNLALLGITSLDFSFAVFLLPGFDALLSDYVSLWALYCHHLCAGMLFVLGAAFHLASHFKAAWPGTCRDLFHGHLIWVCTFLGVHSVGLYAHNDGMVALGRHFDSFSDDALQLRPLFALFSGAPLSPTFLGSAASFACMSPFEWSTSDFLVSHIHAFSAHTTVFILGKGVFYARNSRFVSSKSDLGFRFPCDGPGQGGSCQISSWDHFYLALFWVYNLLSILLFASFWKLQNDLFGFLSSLSGLSLIHSTSDFELQSTYIQGWLRDFLWSQSSQIIQGYGGSCASYTLVFLLSHFLWSFSLMFLFSGRGYWQELIESLLWAHLKLHIVPHLHPRALSITSGRCVGVTHFLIGGVGAFWSFFFSRLLLL